MNLLLVFTGEHCAGCKKLETNILKRGGKISECAIELIDAENKVNQYLLNKYSISSLPTIIVLHNDKIMGNVMGYGRSTMSEVEALIPKEN